MADAAMLNVEKGVAELLMPRQIATPNSERLMKSQSITWEGTEGASHDYRKQSYGNDPITGGRAASRSHWAPPHLPPVRP